MKLLIIGGTQFLGRHYVETAISRGYEVTLFHRGLTNPELFPELEHIHGDRDGEIGKLGDRRWDVVLDPSGYVPRIVKQSAEFLKTRADYYIFISSISVYPDITPNSDESAPLAVLDEPDSEDIPKHYGALKAECESVVLEHFPDNSQIVRAGMIVGPYDKIDRFSYWLRRMSEGGEVLAPGEKDAPVQLIDARDITEWSLDLAKQKTSGIYNVTGPETPLMMSTLLDCIVLEVNPDTRLQWVSNEFLLEKGIGLIDGIPYWLTPDHYGFFQRNIDRALASGLRFRPLEETIRDTWAEHRKRKAPPNHATSARPTRLSTEQEQELLREFASWKAKRPSEA